MIASVTPPRRRGGAPLRSPAPGGRRPLAQKTAAALEEEAGDGLGLRRLLETTMDSVSLSNRDGGPWVDLRKSYVFVGTER